jgi:hypothetical protein
MHTRVLEQIDSKVLEPILTFSNRIFVHQNYRMTKQFASLFKTLGKAGIYQTPDLRILPLWQSFISKFMSNEKHFHQMISKEEWLSVACSLLEVDLGLKVDALVPKSKWRLTVPMRT